MSILSTVQSTVTTHLAMQCQQLAILSKTGVSSSFHTVSRITFMVHAGGRKWCHLAGDDRTLFLPRNSLAQMREKKIRTSWSCFHAFEYCRHPKSYCRHTSELGQTLLDFWLFFPIWPLTLCHKTNCFWKPSPLQTWSAMWHCKDRRLLLTNTKPSWKDPLENAGLVAPYSANRFNESWEPY